MLTPRLSHPPQITKFQTASEIPARFIEKNVSLRGKVHSITERGLEVEHVPIYLPVLSPLLSKHKGKPGIIWSWQHVDIYTSDLWSSGVCPSQEQLIRNLTNESLCVRSRPCFSHQFNSVFISFRGNDYLVKPKMVACSLWHFYLVQSGSDAFYHHVNCKSDR